MALVKAKAVALVKAKVKTKGKAKVVAVNIEANIESKRSLISAVGRIVCGVARGGGGGELVEHGLEGLSEGFLRGHELGDELGVVGGCFPGGDGDVVGAASLAELGGGLGEVGAGGGGRGGGHGSWILGFWGGRAAYIGGRPILGAVKRQYPSPAGPELVKLFFIRVQPARTGQTFFIRVQPARTGQTFFYPSPKIAAKVG